MTVAECGDGEGAGVTFAGDPFPSERKPEQRGADRASHVRAPFAPIETGEREPAAEGAGGLHVHA